jgi:V/A-type H+/Na+-transporting ATPase subunit D
MPQQNIPPTKSNLLRVKEQLVIAEEGYDLLEQKREILVMELMRIVEEVKGLEEEIDKRLETAYPALKHLLLAIGREKATQVSAGIRYDYILNERSTSIAGLTLPSLQVSLPARSLQYSVMDTYADCDKTMLEFFELLKLLTKMASVRTVVWRLAREVKKTQRRVNALDKMVIPETKETKRYIEGVLEEREREAFFVQKMVKNRGAEDAS